MTAAIGLPLLVGRFHADAAVVGSLGMLSGFCGTLVSPLAANFNVVPVALLDLQDRWGGHPGAGAHRRDAAGGEHRDPVSVRLPALSGGHDHPADARARGRLRPRGAGPRGPRVPQQARPRAERPRRRPRAPRPAPAVLRLVRLALLRPRLVDPGARGPGLPRPARGRRDRAPAGRRLHARGRGGGAGLPRPPVRPRLRAALRLGLAAEAGRGARPARRPRRPPPCRDRRPARPRLRRAVQRLPAPVRLPRPLRRAPEQRLRPAAGPRLRPRGGRRRAGRPGLRAADRLARGRPGGAGVGAGPGQLPLAHAHGGRRDAPGAQPRRLPHVAGGVPARRRPRPARDPVHARPGQRPQRRQDRPPRRAEPQPRLGLARGRGRSGARRPLRATALAAAEDHLDASLPHVTGDYMGEHWLASFALLALDAAPEEGA